ncbi:class I SAM-dependent methyltransferase [Ruminococcus sp.]|uniref:class I SAM-dependent methyltransferase n=1 Tax=Ruminococcus sp. TaxID=41978 RepID=UPI00388E4D40
MIVYSNNEVKLKFQTNDKVFSPKAIDVGTISMISKVDFAPTDKILDLGCGYGFVGIYAAQFICPSQVTMSDISDDALKLAKENIALNNVNGIKVIKSDGLDNIDDSGFTLILANPPYHENFSVPKNYIEKGYNKLNVGGKIYLVTKRKEWYKKKLITVFGGTKIHEINGYYVFEAEKREHRKPTYKKKSSHLSKKLARKKQRNKE